MANSKYLGANSFFRANSIFLGANSNYLGANHNYFGAKGDDSCRTAVVLCNIQLTDTRAPDAFYFELT